MNVRKLGAGLFLFHVLSMGACAEKKSDLRREVITVLDDWTTRADARAAVERLGRDAVKRLSAIAADDSETHQRRWHAISLLGNLPDGDSVTALVNIATSAKPVYRCFALQALTETRSEQALLKLLIALPSQYCAAISVVTESIFFSLMVKLPAKTSFMRICMSFLGIQMMGCKSASVSPEIDLIEFSF